MYFTERRFCGVQAHVGTMPEFDPVLGIEVKSKLLNQNLFTGVQKRMTRVTALRFCFDKQCLLKQKRKVIDFLSY